MTWLTWPVRLLFFALWYTREIVVANVAVLRDNLAPGQESTPGIARYTTRCRNDAELTVLAALITLTPGTLTLGTDSTRDRRRVLFVHAMYAADADTLRDELSDMENRLLHALRRKGDSS